MPALSSTEVDHLLKRVPAGATLYLIGAAGCGMSGLAHLFLDLGYRVAGSDLAVNEEVRQLRARGALLHQGHSADHVTAAAPALVVSSTAIRADNPELQQAARARLPMAGRATALAALLHRQRGLCVAGMHGKTTTTAMLAFTLHHLSANPSYAIGALVPQWPQHARFVQPTRPDSLPWFVIEADESDGSLRQFAPECAIALNVDEEHVDYYPNLDAVCAEFADFASRVRGLWVSCADDPRLRTLSAQRPHSVSYGFHESAQYRLVRTSRAQSARPDPSVAPSFPEESFEVIHAGQKLGDFTLSLFGEKNISNAGAVVALLHQLGFEPKKVAAGLAAFRGTARRLQLLFRDQRFCVFDDYGHHPVEIEATLRALRETQARRLLVAFQPHRYTRTQRLQSQFATSFTGADRLWVTEIYPASEQAIPGVTGRALAEAIRAAGQETTFVPRPDDLHTAVRAAMEPGDVVLFLGAGDITRAAHALAAELKYEAGAVHL